MTKKTNKKFLNLAGQSARFYFEKQTLNLTKKASILNISILIYD